MPRLRPAGRTGWRVENVYSVADRIVVLRLGRVAATYDRRTTPREEVVAAITGATHHDVG
jgi:ABC-type sugar transport system ATPase subunit